MEQDERLEFTDDPEELARRAGIKPDGGTRVTEARRSVAREIGADTAAGAGREPEPDAAPGVPPLRERS